MAFTGNFMCTSFKKELLEGVHNFKNSGGNTFKLALYTNSASFTAATTAYARTCFPRAGVQTNLTQLGGRLYTTRTRPIV